MTTYTKATFEMLWDCPACDRVGNLGVTHGFCPGCGHRQDADLRYFPKPHQRHAVTPPSSGRQVGCAHCDVLNDPSHGFCQACGAPLAGSKPVPLRPSIPEHQGETVADARRSAESRKASRRVVQASTRQPVVQPRARPRLPAAPSWAPTDDEPVTLHEYGIRRFSVSPQHWVIAGVCTALALLVLLLVFWKRDVIVEVQGHTWQRSISIEHYLSVHDNEWCTSKPSDAYNVSRRSELHHTNRVPNGQTCRTVAGSCSDSCTNVDNGNGSGSTVCTRTCTPDQQVCETQYRDDPVYADKCYYDVDRWRHTRYAKASGSRLSPEPTWPEPEFRSCTVRRLGCERLGARTQSYTVHFVSKDDHPQAFECEYPQKRWAGYEAGSTWTARVGVLWKRLDCDSLNDRS